MSASTTAMIAAVAAQRNKLIRHFVSAGAVSAEQALSPESLPRTGFNILKHMKAKRVICVTPDGRLYLDQARAAELQSQRRRRAVTIILLVVVLSAIVVVAFVALRLAA